MRRAAFAFVVVALVVVACKPKPKGLPPECEQYLANYDCFLAKSGLTDRATTVNGIRDTWTTASNTSQGRATIVTVCLSQQASMDPQFRKSGCIGVKAPTSP